jgi:hypothetical protein
MQGSTPVAITTHPLDTDAMEPDHTERPSTRLRLTLELQPQQESVAGSLRDEIGGHHRFAGWLDLLTLLEAARLRTQDRDGTEASTS